MLERDSNGDALAAPRFKKVFIVDNHTKGGYVQKQLLVDLMALPDPLHRGNDGDFFRFPFNTIESVHVVDDHTILVANDNNYPFSNARSRSRSADRTGPLAPDDNETILITVGTSLRPDHRLLTAG
jgi:glycerophosphoryl diester phosphodiesterase